MLLPSPRGPLSRWLVAALRTPASTPTVPPAPDPSADPVRDEDLQLALWIAYELHYRGFEGVDDGWEWDPAVLTLRRRLEDEFLAAVRARVAVPPADGRGVPERLWALVDADEGPSVSRFVQREAEWPQFLEFAIHRSVYQLKEADPHTWAIPRLHGPAKAALVEVQTDEYGGGDLERMHSALFAQLLDEVGLDPAYGAYVDAVPAVTLAISNLMSLFGLHRGLRGALVGHLAAYEMTSSAPCRRYAKGLRRLGGSDRACAFYDAHVTADALHEQIAARDLAGALADAEPALAEDIVFGAAACLWVETLFADHLFTAWHHGRSSLHDADVPGLVGAA